MIWLEAHRGSEKELHAAAISSKIVVGEIGQQQQRVGRAERKCKFRRVS